MVKQALIDTFSECKKYNLPICVVLELPDTQSNELIINPPENFEKKIEYYSCTYDENLVNNNNPKIKIVNAFPIEFYSNQTEKGSYDKEEK